MTLAVRIGGPGGKWAHDLAPVANLTWTEKLDIGQGAGGGGQFYTCTWSLPSLAPTFANDAMRRGQLVELFDSGYRLGMGLMTQPDRSDWTFTATGLCQELKNYPCLRYDDEEFEVIPTSNFAKAFEFAKDPINGFGEPHLSLGDFDGTPMSEYLDFPFVKLGDADDNVGTKTLEAGIRTLDDLLSGIARSLGARWWVDEDGVIQMAVDPSLPAESPEWALFPEKVQAGRTDDDFVTTLVGYFGGSSGVLIADNEDTRERYGRVLKVIDMSKLGIGPGDEIDPSQVMADRLASAGPRLGFTDRIDLQALRLQTFGGNSHVHLPSVRLRQVLRIRSVDDDNGNFSFGTSVDVLINEVEQNGQGKPITIAPMGLASRNLTDVLADALAPEQPLD